MYLAHGLQFAIVSLWLLKCAFVHGRNADFVLAPILEQHKLLQTILWQNPEAQHVNTESHHFLWP
jgi:hypothetical protein